MSREASIRYYQKNKEKIKKISKISKSYLRTKKQSKNTVVNAIKISQKIENKS